jgi:hypothetical protein
MPDCWLEVGLHPEIPVTAQIDQSFPWFSLILRANAELVPKFHVALHAPHAALPLVASKFCPNIALPTLAQILL